MRACAALSFAILAAILAACQTVTPQERRAADEQTCSTYGFKPKTEGMARCLLDIDLDRRAGRRAAIARSEAQWDGAWGGPWWGPAVIVERPVYIHRP